MKELDALSTDALVQMALTEKDEEKRWDYVAVLHQRGTLEVFNAAASLCNSRDANERRLGADILAQLGLPERTFPKEALEILHRLIAEDDDPSVLNAALVGIGHSQSSDNRENLDRVIALCAHPDEEVRSAVVFALLGRVDDRSISTLLDLMRDADEDVRDWATFGIGSLIDTDNHEIREALFERLRDGHGDTSAEALVGLARRKDERVYDIIFSRLNEDPGTLILESAEELGDIRLLEPLKGLLETSLKETNVDDYWLLCLRHAIKELEKEH